MIGAEERADDVEREGAGVRFRFIVTLVVTTLMAAFTAYVLSYPMVVSERGTSSHGGAGVALHARS
jgi:hypothetical protein